MRPWLFPLALLCGCATVQTAGTFTHPDRSRPVVHGRSVAVGAVRCDAPNISEGQIPETVAWLDQNVESHVTSNRVPLDGGSESSLCASLASDRVLYEDAVFGTEWKVSAAVATLVKQVAESSRADHVWVPLVRSKPACAESETARDSYSTGTALLDFETPTCAARESDFGLFLFDADGALLWKSSAVAGQSELATREAATRMLLADLPARSPTEGVLVNDTAP